MSDVERLFDCLLHGLPKCVLDRVCDSQHRYPLLMMRSDVTAPSPALEDFIEHQVLVERVIDAFPQKCPREGVCISAFLVLDEHYGYKLSKGAHDQAS